MDNWTEEGRGREDNPPVGEIGQVTWGREERPLTVFVPWDCGKSCPFCTTKEEYGTKYAAADVDENLFRVKTTVRRVLDLRLVDEVVLTGGEPLADPVRLRELVTWIRGTCSFDGRLYVNTSFHFAPEREQEVFDFLARALADRAVTGISVSLPFLQVAGENEQGYQALRRFMRGLRCSAPRWVRINSVVPGELDEAALRRFIGSLKDLHGPYTMGVWALNLRKDYTACTQANLNDCRDPVFAELMQMRGLDYVGSGGCLVCRNDEFICRDDAFDCKLSWHDAVHYVVYHRGTERTSLRYGDRMVIHDLVVKQDGELRYDWVDGTELPLSVARRIQVRPGVREQNRRINRGMLSCRVGPHTLPDDERFFPAE